jgi:hypothetical protein
MKHLVLLLPLALAAAGAACAPPAAPSNAQVKQATRSEAWPQMLAHCLRSPDCDPMANVGDGAGEASNHAGEVTWFAQTGAAEGARLVASLHASRGRGGEAGRTLTIDEQPDSLAGHLSRRSSLMLRFSAQPDAAPQLTDISFRSAWLEPADKAAQDYAVEISGKAGVLLKEPARAVPVSHPAGMRGLSPVTIQFARPAESAALRALLGALRADETLSLKITSPSGAILMSDVIYALGYESALGQANDAARDPEIAATISERCARFASEPDTFWAVANVTPALLVCDPRLPQERH